MSRGGVYRSRGECRNGRCGGEAPARGGGWQGAGWRGLPNLRDYLAQLGEGLSSARERTIDVSGTFNAMEAAGLGAGSAADRIAKASEGCFTQLNAIRFAWGGGKIVEAA
jgi:hypothetical protein